MSRWEGGGPRGILLLTGTGKKTRNFDDHLVMPLPSPREEKWKGGPGKKVGQPRT